MISQEDHDKILAAIEVTAEDLGRATYMRENGYKKGVPKIGELRGELLGMEKIASVVLPPLLVQEVRRKGYRNGMQKAKEEIG